MKERSGGEVVAVAPDAEGADDMLFAAAARGADQLMKLTGDFENGVNNHAMARALTTVVPALEPDLILTGVQAHDDLDGSLGPLLAEYLGMPYVGYISGVSLGEGRSIVRKEYPGGLMAELEVNLPAVLGIQSADQPPRYVAISKIRQAMKMASIGEHKVAELDPGGGPTVSRMFQPETGDRATMIEGDEEEVAARLIKMFQEAGLV
ncbi:MAG: electron transfer flavoprotein subunit beta [Chloroflexota bacterium]|nr:MAG: electron transfer flavoprotein subunit beta [Chloroflexota bacterium]